MNIGLSTTFQPKSILRAFWLITWCILLIQGAFAQTVTVPASNDNDTSTSKPFGCFYGYERTHALYISSEMGSTTGYITHVAFYVNSVSNPASGTPVVIKMKTTSSSSITASTYDAATTGATTVWSGNVTAGMLSANSWITFQLVIPFNYASNNLEVFVETNFGSDGDEAYNAKQFRHSTPTSNRCQYWEDDYLAPTDNGVVTNKRPNIQLTFEEVCSGTPIPGNTLSTIDTVCSGELFTLSMANIGTVPGLTYQWKQKPATGGSYTNISGATNSTYTTSQTATHFYQCMVTCGASSATSAELQVVLKPFYHCYCESAATDESDADIDQVAIGTLVNTSDPFACATYTDYTGVTAPSLNPNQPYTLHIENGSCSGIAFQSFVSAYIDFDRDGTFESLEQVYSYGPIDELNAIPDKTFFVPTLAPPGLTGMRVVIVEGDTPPPACGSYTFGETEDYLVNISAITACSGTPALTTTLSTDTSVCENQLFTLSLTDYPAATNITYQWQYAYTLGSWQTFVGATGSTYTPPTGQIVATYYRCSVTCTISTITTPSDYVFVDMAPFYACYCTSGATSFIDTKIDTVKFGSIVAGSPEEQCETYTDNTSMVTDLVIGEPTPIHIRNGSCSGEFNDAYVAVYIDYNKDHDFEDPDELVYSFGPITEIDGIQDGIITVGGTVATSTTGMRIVLSEVDTIPGPCGEYPYGETEDYAVNIIILPPCDSPPDPGVATSTIDSVCTSATPANITLNIVGYSAGTGQTYQWQSSPNDLTYIDITGTTPTTTAVVSQSTYYRCKVTCSGIDSSSVPVFVNVKPEPPGNLQSDPIIINSLPYSIINDNLAANCWTSDYTSSLPQESPDAFYQVTIGDTTGVLYISMCNTIGFDSYLHLLDETGLHLNSNDNNGPLCTGGNDASIVDTVTSVPFTYYIVVEGAETEEGIYKLEVSFIPDSPTNIIPLASVYDPSLKIFPNPAGGDFTLQLEANSATTEAATLKIYNAIGQVVYSQPVTVVQGKVSEEIKLAESLSDGMYMVEVIAENASWNQNLLIQH